MKYLVVLVLTLIVSCGSTPRPSEFTLTRRGYRYWDSSDFPIYVLVDEQLAYEKFHEIEEAVNTWNDSVGFIVFVPRRWQIEKVPITYNSYVTIVSLELESINPNWVGACFPYFHQRTARLAWATIVIDDDLPWWWYQQVVLHELGHSLGLTHDAEANSIMYPQVVNAPEWQNISEADIRAVRRMATGR